MQSRYKTKVRRLYDIANVLSAIRLIEKVDIYNCVIRKPIFRYRGPIVDCLNFDAGNFQLNSFYLYAIAFSSHRAESASFPPGSETEIWHFRPRCEEK